VHGAAHVIKCAHNPGGTLKIECGLDVVISINLHDYTAVSTKVVPQKCKRRVKVYATVSIGIMGRKSLALLD